MSTVFETPYGTITVLSYERGESEWWRIEHWVNADGKRKSLERTMAASERDASPRQAPAAGYDSRCACCYLGIGHTEELHALRVDASPFSG